MSLKNVQFHSKVIENATSNIVAGPIFAADFKSIEFSVVTTDPACDFNIAVASSIQKTPPDIGLAVSADNQYSTDIAYIDEENGATYNSSSPYNPSSEGGSVSKVFRFNTNGAVWIYVAVTGYVAGTLLGVNVTLSDNQ